ncbi:hybrid sensor histidine kinase/response regulator [Halobacterium zhouii]|uniref:hybrid sensor histidine kinase/response regulator n=1 Tax=Halobacterium zhouii TaxID=2902624 RepID=UPI001E3CBA72|nr:response regulator [Halobacterium zhouii]
MRRGSNAVRVLLVEDDDTQADLTASFLEREDDAFAVTTRSAAEPALEHLQDGEVDCVVSDHDMPGKNGLELLDAVRGVDPDLPFVLFTGKGSEEIASDAISAGVTDYLQKEGGSDQYAVLANRVRNAVEKRRSQRALREEKHRLEQVLATTPGSVVFTPDGGVVSATDRARATLGLDGDDAPDRELASIDNGIDEEPDWELTTIDGDPIPDDDHPATRVARSGQPLHGVRLGVVWPDGWRKYLVMHCAPLFEDGEVDRVVASFTDITDRVERERTLERTQTVIEAVGDAVYTVDENGAFAFVNDAFEEMFDADRENLLGTTVAELAERGDFGPQAVSRYQDAVRDLVAASSPDARRRFEFRVRRAGIDDDRVFECHLALRPNDGGFRGTIGAVRDVTEQKRRERELEVQNDRLAEFTNVVSHDLRSPLNVATGWLERYRETGDEAALDRVERSHDRMTEILDELLALARNGPDAHDTDEVALEAVCASAWASVTTEDASLGVDAAGATVEAAESRLQELFENLFANALEHVGSGAAVRVGLLEDDDGFYVADDGPGIPAVERDEVFEMGHTTSEDGTGFGLAIVEQVADAHDWTVRLTESEADPESDTEWAGGARFEFVTASENEQTPPPTTTE